MATPFSQVVEPLEPGLLSSLLTSSMALPPPRSWMARNWRPCRSSLGLCSALVEGGRVEGFAPQKIPSLMNHCVDCNCNTHPMVLRKKGLEVRCLVNQAFFFSDIRRKAFGIWSVCNIYIYSIYLFTPSTKTSSRRKLYDHISTSRPDRQEKNKNLWRIHHFSDSTLKKNHIFRQFVFSPTFGPLTAVWAVFFSGFRPHEVFHVDALHVHLWRIKLDGSRRSLDEHRLPCIDDGWSVCYPLKKKYKKQPLASTQKASLLLLSLLLLLLLSLLLLVLLLLLLLFSKFCFA